MNSIRRSLLVWSVGPMLLLGGIASATPEEKQIVPGEQQDAQQQLKLRQVAFVLAYLQQKKGEAVTLRDIVKAKLVTRRVKAFLTNLKQCLQESSQESDQLAAKFKIAILAYRASTADEQDEATASSAMLERMKTILADRVGEHEVLVAVRDWAQEALERVQLLKEKVSDCKETTPLLNRFETKLQSIVTRAEALIED